MAKEIQTGGASTDASGRFTLRTHAPSQVQAPSQVRGRTMPPHNDHEHEGSELSEMTLRVRALETVLTEKGYVDPAALDLIVEAYETRIGPRNGTKAVARAWSDPQFKDALLADA